MLHKVVDRFSTNGKKIPWSRPGGLFPEAFVGVTRKKGHLFLESILGNLAFGRNTGVLSGSSFFCA